MRVENVKGAVWTVDELEFYKRRPQRLQERLSTTSSSSSSSGYDNNKRYILCERTLPNFVFFFHLYYHFHTRPSSNPTTIDCSNRAYDGSKLPALIYSDNPNMNANLHTSLSDSGTFPPFLKSIAGGPLSRSTSASPQRTSPIPNDYEFVDANDYDDMDNGDYDQDIDDYEESDKVQDLRVSQNRSPSSRESNSGHEINSTERDIDVDREDEQEETCDDNRSYDAPKKFGNLEILSIDQPLSCKIDKDSH